MSSLIFLGRTAVIYVLVKSLVLTLESTLPTPFFSIWTGVKREYEFFFAVIYVLGNSLILTHSNERIYTILYVLG